MYNKIKDNLNISSKWNNIYYLFHLNQDIIVIDEPPQYSILIGSIDNKNNSYIIKYILEFNSSNILNDEKMELLNSSY